MKKLNNKGITTIEVIICFVLVVIITLSMYSTISYFNEKRVIEGYKEQIYTYKDLLTKDIQDDFIKVGLTHVKYTKSKSDNIVKHTVNCTLKDGTKRDLIIEQRLGKSPYHMAGKTDAHIASKANDYFMIKYGNPAVDGGIIEYPIPSLGYTRYKGTTNELCKDNESENACRKIQDLSIDNIFIDVNNENIISIYIGFYHPELGTRYGINIVSPVDYVTDGGTETTKWKNILE